MIKTKADPTFKSLVESCIMVFEKKKTPNFLPEGFESAERIGVLTELSMVFITEEEFFKSYGRKMQSIPALAAVMEEWCDENNEKHNGIFIRDPERPHRRVVLQRWCGTNWYSQVDQPSLQLRPGQARAVQELYCKDEIRCRPKPLRSGAGPAFTLQQVQAFAESVGEAAAEEPEPATPAVNLSSAQPADVEEIEETMAAPTFVLPSVAQAQAKAEAKTRGSKRKPGLPIPEPATRQRTSGRNTLTAASLAALPSSGESACVPSDRLSVAETVGSRSRRVNGRKDKDKLATSAEHYVEELSLAKILGGWACGREKHAAERVVKALNEREQGCPEALALQSHLDLVEAALVVSADSLLNCKAEEKHTHFELLRSKVPLGSEPPKWKFTVLASHLKEQRLSASINIADWLDTVNPLGEEDVDAGSSSSQHTTTL